MTEKTTDLIISKLLDASSIEHYAESCPIEEINKAMVSKRGTGKKGFPEYLAISGDFVIVIEDKAKVEEQTRSALLFVLFTLVLQVTKFFQRSRTSVNSRPKI